VLVKARDLGAPRTGADDAEVTYFHLLFDSHQIVFAEGVATESYLPGPATMRGFDAGTQAEILALFPELGSGAGYGPAARPMLKGREARPLLAAMAAAA